jgi:hypothetical protein
MVGPSEELMLLIRDEMLAGVMEAVFSDSRIVMSEGERRDVSIEGGWACDGGSNLSGDIRGTDGGRRRASRDCRWDFNLQNPIS